MHSLGEKNQYVWLMVTWPWLDIGLSICVCARLCVLFTCQIGIFLKKRSCTMWLKLVRPHDIGQQQSLNNRWANHFTSAERRWWGRVILALVWSVCSAAPVFRRYNYTHTCPHVAVSLFFPCLFGVWLVLALPHHHTFTHIFSTYLQPCVCPEGTVSQRKHAGWGFYLFYIFIPMLFPFPCTRAQHLLCSQPSQTAVWHLCPFGNQLFFRPSHLRPRTAFLFWSLRHLMSNSYALVCRLLLNNPTRVNALKSCYSL